jgi:hypothetical protein
MKNRNLPRQLPSAEANFEGCDDSRRSEELCHNTKMAFYNLLQFHILNK